MPDLMRATTDLGKSRLIEMLRDRIAREGPIPFEQFMESALYEPGLGYYSSPVQISNDAASPLADFQTSPQVHPLFGYLISLELRRIWELLDYPQPFIVVELGAGAGELCRHILAGLSDGKSPVATQYHAVDWRYAGAGIRSKAPQGRESDSPLWFANACVDHGSIEALVTRWPDLRTLAMSVRGVQVVISNEFFDALPVHRLTRIGGALREIYVDWAESGFIERVGELSDPCLVALVEHRVGAKVEGWRGEVCSRVETVLSSIAGIVDRGYVLTIDYGYELGEAPGSSGETLVGYYRHQWNDDVYRRVGEQDLTSHVDVAAFLELGQKVGLAPVQVTTQREFLLRLGFTDEATRRAAREPTPGRQWQARFAMAELIDPQGLGRLKVITQEK
jgi:SAM-dependent MidA family methyltransferase